MMLICMTLVLLTVSACGSEPSNSPSAQAEIVEQETFELADFGLVAVPAGVLQAGKSYYFVPSTAASGGISVYSFARGGIIGSLVERLFETGPGMIQDLTEGPRTFYWDGQFTSINRATGEIRVYALEDADADEAEDAKIGEDTQAKTGEEEKVNKNQPRKIAHVEDNRTWRSIGQSMFGGDVMTFNSCEELISMLSADPSLNFSAYVLDNDLGPGLMRGPACVQQILALRPGAVIIGLSGGFDDPGFVNSGANTWVSKTKVDINTFRDLLP